MVAVVVSLEIAAPPPTAAHEVSVPFVVRYLPEFPPWLGASALNAALAVVWPVPPLANASAPESAVAAPVSFVEFETDKGHDAFLLDVPEFYDVLRGFIGAAAEKRGL